MSEIILKEEEKVAFALRSLYKKYGYLPYKMSKFEEYDLYAGNKEFLISDGVITFTDTDGKLLALKPDVTLSIIKNVGDTKEKKKVYYHENVYRISGATKQFKEIMQAGVECIGNVDEYDVYETVCLAVKSLQTISSKFVLDISHLGILSAVLEEIGLGEIFDQKIMHCIAEKNMHELRALCDTYQVSAEEKEKLQSIVCVYGDMQTVLKRLAPICSSGKALAAYNELEKLYELLKENAFAEHIRFDFSVINDMKYYNGIVFKGFVDGICEGVLSGGQYDRLMTRMHKKTRAIGFAVYLGLVEGFGAQKSGFDVDVVLLYDDKTDVKRLALEVETLIQEGYSVSAQKSLGTVRYKRLIDITGGKL